MARKINQGSGWLRDSKRLALYARDGFACVYCGAHADDGVKLTADHIVAQELGGTCHESNLVTACASCNSAKQHLTTRVWFARLRARGLDTTKIGARIRRLIRKPLDRAEGLRLARARRA